MSTFTPRDFSEPDEVLSFDKGHIDVVTIGAMSIMRAVFEPGWVWSESLKPIARTEMCEVAHLGFMVSGRMGIRMEDGSEGEFAAGEVGWLPSGHDVWTIGSDPAVFIDFQGAAAAYAKSL